MTQPLSQVVQPLRIADSAKSLRHVFVRDLTLSCSIGVHAHEKHAPQRIRVNLDMAVDEGDITVIADDIRNVVCYEQMVNGVRALVAAGHVNLVETLAERIAAMAMTDRRVRTVRVRVEKLDVFPDALSVGVEIERDNPRP